MQPMRCGATREPSRCHRWAPRPGDHRKEQPRSGCMGGRLMCREASREAIWTQTPSCLPAAAPALGGHKMRARLNQPTGYCQFAIVCVARAGGGEKEWPSPTRHWRRQARRQAGKASGKRARVSARSKREAPLLGGTHGGSARLQWRARAKGKRSEAGKERCGSQCRPLTLGKGGGQQASQRRRLPIDATGGKATRRPKPKHMTSGAKALQHVCMQE